VTQSEQFPGELGAGADTAALEGAVNAIARTWWSPTRLNMCERRFSHFPYAPGRPMQDAIGHSAAKVEIKHDSLGCARKKV
jgi:hypothetical protein